MKWSSEIDAAHWWVDRLRPFDDHVVGSMVPSGFEAITRIFHPIEDHETGAPAKWADVAAANGRVAHAEMQLHRIASTQGEDRRVDDVPSVATGFLPQAERRHLADLLLASGSTGPVWFGFSDINSGFHHEANANCPRAGDPNRQYFLIRGELNQIDEISLFASGTTEEWYADSPNIWWPEDQSWFVVSEIDFQWTYVGGPKSLIEKIESSPELEAIRSDYEHKGYEDADRLNPP